ncbi:MAG: lysophospholipid acyltransferase family protein [Rikenellaceae bacterium]|nr:lysophospholipid acyltransferase family protein [Rikenellaceae bacterium]
MKKAWNSLAYGVLLGLLKAVGWLPYWFLYGVLAPCIYVLVYRLAGYRTTVVRENLSRAFPEKSTAELQQIERKFYRHLSELFVDTIDLTSMSEKQIRKRFRYLNAEEVQEQTADRNWICAMAHYGSWEYTINFALFTDHRVGAVYHYLHHPLFERFYRQLRSRFGSEPIPTSEVVRELVKTKNPGAKPLSLALIADQTPKRHTIDHWFQFHHQPTAFFMGTGKIARKFHMPVYFLDIRKIKSGYYTGRFELLYDGHGDLDEYQIVELYVRRLEAMIRQRPELWLWSHRRWKHKPQHSE